MANITFKPKQVTKRITSHLKDRAADVIVGRFGLGTDARRKTLEEIGKKYSITRERVRQIENVAIALIKKSAAYKKEQAVFEELEALIRSLGSMVSESELFSHVSKDPGTQNHVNFFLTLGDVFKKHSEDEHFHTRWSVDDEVSEAVHQALHSLYASLDDEDLLQEAELVNKFLDHLKETSNRSLSAEMAKRWLGISKRIKKNPLGEWGKHSSPNVRARGVRDYAFLVMRRHGSPMHFKEVADAIEKTFGQKTHYATCHNELIKDERFVLVGRGIYALAIWGYKSGTAREVIMEILKKHGPLSQETVIDKMMKERYFKKNTILVNLANSKYFKKNKGLYSLV